MTQSSEPSKVEWKCGFCDKKFVHEKNYLKHRCKEMERAQTMQTVAGQSAYRYYAYWMGAKRRKVPSAETFMDSVMFTSFCKFYDFVVKLHIPAPERYIDLMVKHDFDPKMWTLNDCYKLYLDWIDRCSDPFDQAATTVDMLYQLSEATNVPVQNVFEAIHPREVIELIRLRKLSPWLLFASSRFKNLILTMDQMDRESLLETVGNDFWSKRFRDNQPVVEKMLAIAKEMGI